MSDGTTITLDNGDMTLSDNTKGNIYYTTGPIIDFAMRQVRQMIMHEDIKILPTQS